MQKEIVCLERPNTMIKAGQSFAKDRFMPIFFTHELILNNMHSKILAYN